jgi:hypothetical protein
MSALSKEKVAALEALLDVKLPEGDLVVEIRPAARDELSDEQLADASGGTSTLSNMSTPRVQVRFAGFEGSNWLMKM